MGMPPLDRAFPAVAVRDAVALVRLLWLMESGNEDLSRREALTAIGQLLGDTLRQGRMDPRSLGYRAAIHRSEEAVARLGWSGERSELVRLASERVRGRLTREMRREAS